MKVGAGMTCSAKNSSVSTKRSERNAGTSLASTVFKEIRSNILLFSRSKTKWRELTKWEERKWRSSGMHLTKER